MKCRRLFSLSLPLGGPPESGRRPQPAIVSTSENQLRSSGPASKLIVRARDHSYRHPLTVAKNRRIVELHLRESGASRSGWRVAILEPIRLARGRIVRRSKGI